MKRYIKSAGYIKRFPEKIEIEIYPGQFITYTKMYEHDGGGCYYRTTELTGADDMMFGSFVSLYPDGVLTYLWNGTEHQLNYHWR